MADEQLIARGKGQPGTEAPQCRDLSHGSGAIDAIDLSCLAASPQVAAAVESDALGVIQPGCEDRKSLPGDQGRDLLVVVHPRPFLAMSSRASKTKKNAPLDEALYRRAMRFDFKIPRTGVPNDLRFGRRLFATAG